MHVHAFVVVESHAGTSLTSLSFLSGVSTISGFLRIRDCPALASLAALASLRTISGAQGIGLLIWNNGALTSLAVRSLYYGFEIIKRWCLFVRFCS